MKYWIYFIVASLCLISQPSMACISVKDCCSAENIERGIGTMDSIIRANADCANAYATTELAQVLKNRFTVVIDNQ